MGLVKLEELPELKISEGIIGRAVTARTMTVMHVVIEAGALVPEHSHYHEQVVNVIEGELELVVEGEKHNLVSLHENTARELSGKLLSWYRKTVTQQ